MAYKLSGYSNASYEDDFRKTLIERLLEPAVLVSGRPGEEDRMTAGSPPLPETNRLLASLHPSDLELLTPHLRVAHGAQGTLFLDPGDPIDQVYFPHSGMISLMAIMHDGSAVETATIGREGAMGSTVGFGSKVSVGRAIVQVPGEFSRISAARFTAAVAQSKTIKTLFIRYHDAQLACIHQSAGCNALHQLEQRLCRWLLQTRDRCETDALPLTQEFLADMLGVRRTTVTMVARLLQAEGLVRYRRGRIEIVDRPGLELRACECYGLVRRKNEEVFLTPAGKLA